MDEQVARVNVASGAVTMFVVGSMVGITTIEFEPGLISGFKEVWQRLAHDSINYSHDRVWGDGNGYSHVRASLLGPFLIISFQGKRLALGIWQ